MLVNCAAGADGADTSAEPPLLKESDVTWTLPEPMLSTPVPSPDLRSGWAGEPKWDGFRALISVDAGQVVLRSRRGTEMGPSFPEVGAGAVQLPDATSLERRTGRMGRRGPPRVRAAAEPACPAWCRCGPGG